MNNCKCNAIARSGPMMIALIGTTCSFFGADIDFNSYTSPGDNDLVNNFLTGASFHQVTDNGITGGAVASESPLGGFATYRNGQSQPTTVSISFRYDGVQTPGLGPSARLGWVGSLAPVDFLQSSLYFSGEYYNDGSFSVRNNPTGQPGASTLVPLGSITPPTLGHWLQLSFTATPLGGANYQLALVLADLGTSGLDNPNVLFSGSTPQVNGLAAADNSMFPGFYGYYRAPYYDNFSVQAVPEPSSIILLGLGGMTLLGFRIRKLRPPE